MIRTAVSRIRHRSVSLTVIAGLLVQASRPLISLVTLPLLLAHLGEAGLGVWMIALSLMGLMTSLNAGLSVSLVTLVSRASTECSLMILNRLATAAVIIAVLTSGLIMLVSIPAAFVIDWTRLLGLGPNPSGDEVRWLMVALASLMGFVVIASVPRQIMLGRMHGYLAQMLDLVGVVVGATALIIGLKIDAPLWLLALAFMAPSSLAMIAGGAIYLHRAGIRFALRRYFHRQTLAVLGRDSLRMAGYQTAYAVSSQSDLFLIGLILGAPATTAYGLAQRIFFLPILLASTVNNAQWPALARADAAGDQATVSKMFWHTLLIGSLVASLVAIFEAWFYEPLINLWLGHELETEPAILVGMVVWVLVATLVSTCDSLLRARNETALLMRSMMRMAAINIAVTLYLLPRIGPAGAIWGSVTGFTLALLVPYTLRLWKGNRQKR